ncbi:MAG TPA: extracellular solute-binding protein [Candidatus Limnocylindria bacterium]|nr:extracellular solute-binding protein [Candidatus Limnocylindria bacterium]
MIRQAPVNGARSLACGGVGLLAIVIAACGGAVTGGPATATPRSNEQTAALVAAARTELELTLSWAPGFLDSSQEIRRQTEGFNKLYGLNLKVNFKPGLPMRDATAVAIQEYQRGMKASSDVVLGTETDISDLQKAGTLQFEPWSTWATNVNNPRLVAAGGVAVKVQTRIPGITYNPSKVTGAAIPRTLTDLLKPQFKGRIATTANTAFFERLAGSELWGAERTLGYARKFVGQISGFMNCGEEDRVANGEFDVFVYDCGSARVSQMKAKGTLIGWSVPTDGALLGYLYMGVPKNAAHPNAAKLWINYMLGREAQDAMYENGFADFHLIDGSRTFAEVDKATKSGVKFYELSVEGVLVDQVKGVKPIGPELQAMFREAVAARK